ncbi:hypothetical protein WYO_0336, partial [Methylobacterium sp. GXF4]
MWLPARGEGLTDTIYPHGSDSKLLADFHVCNLAHPHVKRFLLGDTHRVVGVLEETVIRLVGPSLLSCDDKVDWDPDRSNGLSDQVDLTGIL